MAAFSLFPTDYLPWDLLSVSEWIDREIWTGVGVEVGVGESTREPSKVADMQVSCSAFMGLLNDDKRLTGVAVGVFRFTFVLTSLLYF